MELVWGPPRDSAVQRQSSAVKESEPALEPEHDVQMAMCQHPYLRLHQLHIHLHPQDRDQYRQMHDRWRPQLLGDSRTPYGHF